MAPCETSETDAGDMSCTDGASGRLEDMIDSTSSPTAP